MGKSIFYILTVFVTSIAVPAETFSAEVEEEHDIRYLLPYDKQDHERHRLDVYYSDRDARQPVMIWIHGGGWRFGDKRAVHEKPQAFVDRGFVFVAINYRFAPEVAMDAIASDVAAAVCWTRDHIGDYGGDPDQLFVGGHSAGAHLAALVCTDPRYLQAQGLKLENISGCVPVDTAVYNAAGHISDIQRLAPRRGKLYTNAFGEDAATQKKFSPLTYVEKNSGIPPFCLLYVADRRDAKKRTLEFSDALRAAGIEAVVVPGEDKTHGTINRDLGEPKDEPTQKLFEFLTSRSS